MYISIYTHTQICSYRLHVVSVCMHMSMRVCLCAVMGSILNT